MLVRRIGKLWDFFLAQIIFIVNLCLLTVVLIICQNRLKKIESELLERAYAYDIVNLASDLRVNLNLDEPGHWVQPSAENPVEA